MDLNGKRMGCLEKVRTFEENNKKDISIMRTIYLLLMKDNLLISKTKKYIIRLRDTININ